MPKLSTSTFDDYKRQVVEAANGVGRALTGDFEQVCRIVEQNELVFAVWRDPGEPDGVGTLIVKGEQFLRGVIADKLAKQVTWSAIPCTCIEQAVALKQVAGEPDRRH